MKYIKHLLKKRFHFLDIVKNKTYYTRLNLQLQRKRMLEEEFKLDKLMFHLYLLHSNIYYENERIRKRKIPYEKEYVQRPGFFKFKENIDKYEIKEPKLLKIKPLLNNIRIKRSKNIRNFMSNNNQNYRKIKVVEKSNIIGKWLREDIMEDIKK
jgi:hypothetical protein